MVNLCILVWMYKNIHDNCPNLVKVLLNILDYIYFGFEVILKRHFIDSIISVVFLNYFKLRSNIETGFYLKHRWRFHTHFLNKNFFWFVLSFDLKNKWLLKRIFIIWLYLHFNYSILWLQKIFMNQRYKRGKDLTRLSVAKFLKQFYLSFYSIIT